MSQSYEFVPVTGGGSLTCTTSFQDISNLTTSVIAPGGTYEFDAYVTWRASATSTTFMLGLGGAFTATFLSYRVSIATNNTGGSSSFVCNAKSPTAVSGAAAVTATDLPCIVSGLLVANAGGTFTIQAKHGTATGTVQSGGRMQLRQIA